MKTGADFEKGGDSAAHANLTAGWFSNTGKDFQKSGFAGAVAADDADHFARLDLEIDVFEGPEIFAFVAGVGGSAKLAKWGGEQTRGHLAEGLVRRGLVAQAVTLADTFDDDCGLRHLKSCQLFVASSSFLFCYE
jgi:hypothetical protein